MRTVIGLCILSAVLCCGLPRQAAAETDPLPIIVTYEMKKERQDARIVARNPKAFWIHQIVTRIEDRKQDLAKPLKDPVTVQVAFVVGRDGHLVSKSVAKSSGNTDADKLAIAMLEGAQPFPPMPAAMSDAELSFTMPVRFRGAAPP